MRRPLPLALCAAALAGCGAGRGPQAETVVVVVVDTLRRDALSCYGAPAGATPAIDALAADGLRFEQAVASSSWTLPSVASLFSGAWPEVHKATGQRTLLTPVSPDVPLAAELFRAAGFATIGVANAAFLSPLLGLGRGFDVYDHRHAFNRELRRAGESVAAALAHLDRAGGRDVFLFVHLFDPHLDYDPEPRRAAPFTLAEGRAVTAPDAATLARVRELYAGEVAAVDRAVGALLAGLRARGRYADATVVLVADHGEEHWDHGGFEHGHALWDELVRVPLILKLPADAGVAPGAVAAQVRLVDVLPTLLAEQGLLAPPSAEGASLLPLEALGGRPAFSQDPLYGTDRLSWRTERWQYVHDRGAGARKRGWLFDLAADPRALHDVIDARPEVAARLEQELARFWSELRARGAGYRRPNTEDLSPTRVRALRDSLESLGYAGGEDG